MGPERPALHVHDLTLPGEVRLRLRLLGASHQVVLAEPGGAAGLTETVACLPGRPPHLPGALFDEAGGYRFTAKRAAPRRRRVAHPYRRGSAPTWPTTRTPWSESFPVTRTRSPRWPYAPTCRHGSVGWRTWHAYPQTNELVLTETVVALR